MWIISLPGTENAEYAYAGQIAEFQERAMAEINELKHPVWKRQLEKNIRNVAGLATNDEKKRGRIYMPDGERQGVRNSGAGHGRRRKENDRETGKTTERSRRTEKKGRTGNGLGQPASTETVQRNKGKEKEEHKNA